MDALLIGSLLLGLILGVEHALDADHVVAVTTIVSRYRNILRSTLIGIVWGLGHTTTLFIVGLAVIGFRLVIPESLALFFEFSVGIMLVTLGVITLRDWYISRRHLHQHAHETLEHAHGHQHSPNPEADEHGHGLHRPYLIGTVHGLAGSAALMLVILSQIDSPIAGLAYIVLFGLGSIIGMMTVTTLIALPIVFTATRFASLNLGIRLVAGTISSVLGIAIMYQIGFIEGLFLQI